MISIDDLIIRFGIDELKNLSHNQNYDDIDEKVINRAIEDACGLIESYLNPTGLLSRGRGGKLVYVHATPQTPMPRALIAYACDITRYYLYENGVNETVDKRYEQAVNWLKLVSANPAMLTGKKDTTEHSTSGVFVMPNPKPDMWQGI